jgi:hypothetical protein
MRTAAAPMPREPPVMSAALPASEITVTPAKELSADYTDTRRLEIPERKDDIRKTRFNIRIVELTRTKT